jgi:hypothetical protein
MRSHPPFDYSQTPTHQYPPHLLYLLSFPLHISSIVPTKALVFPNNNKNVKKNRIYMIKQVIINQLSKNKWMKK